MRYILLFLCLFSCLDPVHAKDIDTIKKEYQKIGDGKLRWFGFSIYEASLYSKTGSFTDPKTDRPAMLVIKYLRDIDKDDLIERTFEEWERLPYFNAEKFKAWLPKLDKIWHDIKENDFLACVLNKDGTATFYNQHRKLGDLNDPDFGWTFLSIWLAESTSESKLRRQLLNLD